MSETTASGAEHIHRISYLQCSRCMGRWSAADAPKGRVGDARETWLKAHADCRWEARQEEDDPGE